MPPESDIWDQDPNVLPPEELVEIFDGIFETIQGAEQQLIEKHKRWKQESWCTKNELCIEDDEAQMILGEAASSKILIVTTFNSSIPGVPESKSIGLDCRVQQGSGVFTRMYRLHNSEPISPSGTPYKIRKITELEDIEDIEYLEAFIDGTGTLEPAEPHEPLPEAELEETLEKQFEEQERERLANFISPEDVEILHRLHDFIVGLKARE